MKITISGKNISLTKGIKDAINTKMSRLDKYVDESVEAKAIVSTAKYGQKVEITIFLKKNMVKAESIEEDLYVAIDKIIDKLARQLQKYNTKLLKQNGPSIRQVEEPAKTGQDMDHEEDQNHGKIVRRKKFDIKPMTEEEAIMQMELLDHPFFVYRNEETGKVSVLYKREDGDLGLIAE